MFITVCHVSSVFARSRSWTRRSGCWYGTHWDWCWRRQDCHLSFCCRPIHRDCPKNKNHQWRRTIGDRSNIDHAVYLQCLLRVRGLLISRRVGKLIPYSMINIGSLAGIATTFLEKDVGFWSANLLCFCTMWPSLIILLVWRKSFGMIIFIYASLLVAKELLQ